MKKAELEAIKKFLEQEKYHFGYIENIFSEVMMVRPANDFGSMITGFEMVTAATMKESEFTDVKELLKDWIKKRKQSKFNQKSSGFVLFPVIRFTEFIQNLEQYYEAHKEEEDG